MRRSIVCAVVFAVVCMSVPSFAAAPIVMGRYPAPSPDGATLAFSYAGDLWTVPIGGGDTTEGGKPFSRVELVRYISMAGSTSGNEYVQIGVGNIFGLPEVVSSAAAVRSLLLLPGTTLSTPADYTVIATPGQQGVWFTNPANDPDGANSYQIIYDNQ